MFIETTALIQFSRFILNVCESYRYFRVIKTSEIFFQVNLEIFHFPYIMCFVQPANFTLC